MVYDKNIFSYNDVTYDKTVQLKSANKLLPRELATYNFVCIWCYKKLLN